MRGKIFLSYRRKDEQGYAQALFARLEQSFSRKSLFLDVEGGVAPGQDFVLQIEDQVNACDVMLVLIGPKWLTATDEMDRRRLDNPQDYVRIEVESALRLGKTVIPVLVGNAAMPRADVLPEPLRPLSRLQAVVLAEWGFGADAQGLIKQLENVFAKVQKPISRRLLQGLGAAVALAAIAGASWMFLYADESILTFTGHDRFVRSVAFAPDGRTALSGSTDSTVRLWDVASGKEIHRLAGHLGLVTSVAFAPDGHTALSAGADGTLKLWDVAARKEIRSFAVGYDISEIRTPDGRVLRSLTDDSVLSIAFGPDGRTALSGSSDKTVRLWDIASGSLIRSFTGHDGAVTSVAFAPDGRTALSGSYDKTAWLWDIASGSVIRKFTWHTDEVTSVAFAPDGRTALSSSRDGMLKLSNVENGEELRKFTGHPVWTVAFAPDGLTALAGGYSTFFIPRMRSSKMLTLWDVKNGNEIRPFIGHHGAVYSVAFAPDGHRALSGGSDGTLKLWDLGVPK